MVAVLCVILAPTAGAQVVDQKSILTFGQSISVPDRVLDPGSYVFKVALVQTAGRDIVQVLSKDEKQLLGTYITVQKYRPEAVDGVTVTFREMPGGSPPGIDTWWHTGQRNGHQFIYPKSLAGDSAAIRVLPEPSPSPWPESLTAEYVPTEELPAEMENSSSATVELTGDEPLTTEMSEPAATLPKTASALPLIGLLGVLSMVAAFGLTAIMRVVTRQPL